MADAESAPGASAFPFALIKAPTVANIVHGDIPGAVETVRQAYLAHADGRCVMPPSPILRFPDKAAARIIALPAYVGEPWRSSGIKWIASYPDNIRRGIPRASAVLILNDDETGYPIACLEGSIISAARTAALAALAAAELSPRGRHAQTLAIVGTGLIARYVHRFLVGTGWQIERLLLFDLEETHARRFAGEVAPAGCHREIDIARSGEEALAAADLVLLATVATTPHLHDPAAIAHNPTILNISLRDLAPEMILAANNVADDVDHVMAANTSLHLTEQRLGHRDFVAGTLAGHMRGEFATDPDKPTIFSPFGMGVLDVALARGVYDRAVAAREHLAIDGFFVGVDG